MCYNLKVQVQQWKLNNYLSKDRKDILKYKDMLVVLLRILEINKKVSKECILS